ncbi:MAG: acyl-[Lachnospiraceae bacterium]|nr:acyl-[acyl-carrier-protein] thioesterase [Lachnospiraceae bacterium]
MYTFDSRVRYSETDEKGLLSIAGIVDYFQDTSTFQSEDLGLGVEFLKKQDLAWVMSAWQIVIHSCPGLGERITVGTFPYDFKGFMGMRNFFLMDEKGNRIVEANSVWTLLNIKKGLPVRATQEMLDNYVLEEKLPMEYAPRKITVPDGGEKQDGFEVGRQHLDSNHHVNNGQYIHMAMEYLPENFVVGQLRAEYKKQAHLHDRIVPIVYRDEDKMIVSLCSEQEEPYAIVELKRM